MAERGPHHQRDALRPPQPDDEVLLDTRTAEPPFEMPTILWSELLGPHSLQNVGDVELRFIPVELKN